MQGSSDGYLLISDRARAHILRSELTSGSNVRNGNRRSRECGIMTTSVNPSTSIDAKLRELYLCMRQDQDDDASCPFPWHVHSLQH